MALPTPIVAAILLTGGSSRRMGTDKAQIVVDGETLAGRTARLLRLVVELAVEVGPGVSGLPACLEAPVGEGPLVAIAAGYEELIEKGHRGDALVVACDLPMLSEGLLRLLAGWRPAGATVLPIVLGELQPLCARWGVGELARAQGLVAEGQRSLRHVADQPSTVVIDEASWGHVAEVRTFSDVDCREDAARLGILVKVEEQ